MRTNIKENEKPGFKVRAAKASWVIPIIAVGIMMFGRAGFQTPFGSLFLGGIIILLLISGIKLSIVIYD